MTDILSRFKQVLQTQKLFHSREKVFIACSGGPDSVALYFLLKETVPENSFGLIHFNHKLRGRASDADERFISRLAKKEKIPFITGRAPVKSRQGKKSLEEAARHERYAFFQAAAKKHRIGKIATAHTLDDQAETILMRVLQGTGPQGLAGIRRSFKFGTAAFIRPLLSFEKREVLEFLRKRKIAFRRDQSNDSPRFLRNRIRRALLPQLEREYNPRVREALARIPAILEEENELLESLKNEAWSKCAGKKLNSGMTLKRSRLSKLSAYLQFWTLDRALKTLDPQSGMSFEAWQRIKPKLESSHYRCSLPKELDMELTPSLVGIYKRKPLRHNR